MQRLWISRIKIKAIRKGIPCSTADCDMHNLFKIGYWICLSMVPCAMLYSCMAYGPYRQLETNPLCREKRRTCAEYERMVGTGANNSSTVLRELRAACNYHTQACARAVEDAK